MNCQKVKSVKLNQRSEAHLRPTALLEMNESDEDDERSYVMVSGGCGQDVSGEDDLETGGGHHHQKLKKRASSGSSAKSDLGLLHPQALLFCSLWYVFSGRTSSVSYHAYHAGISNTISNIIFL